MSNNQKSDTVKSFLNRKDSGYIVLLDPEKVNAESAVKAALNCKDAGVDYIFLGGSSASGNNVSDIIKAIKAVVSIPIIIFPGNAAHFSPNADAILFMSLVSGRNPKFLIEEQVTAAPYIKKSGLATISMGYILIESDKQSATEIVSQTTPLKRDDIDSAVAHALASEYMGMRCIYLEGGSGSSVTVPLETITAVSNAVSIPVIVGGGIKDTNTIEKIIKAGARYIVTGNILEKENKEFLMKEFGTAVHNKV